MYLFAHNDKTSAANQLGQISSTTATLIHYVETEDVLDNMKREDNSTTVRALNALPPSARAE